MSQWLKLYTTYGAKWSELKLQNKKKYPYSVSVF